METRTLRMLTGRDEYPLPPDSDIAKIVRTYHAWRGEPESGEYEDVPGFCRSATLDLVAEHGYVLTPGRYVGSAQAEDDGEPFADKMKRLSSELHALFAEADQVEADIRTNLAGLGYGE